MYDTFVAIRDYLTLGGTNAATVDGERFTADLHFVSPLRSGRVYAYFEPVESPNERDSGGRTDGDAFIVHVLSDSPVVCAIIAAKMFEVLDELKELSVGARGRLSSSEVSERKVQKISAEDESAQFDASFRLTTRVEYPRRKEA